MSKNRNRRRFYPEFYTDDELKRLKENECDGQEEKEEREINTGGDAGEMADTALTDEIQEIDSPGKQEETRAGDAAENEFKNFNGLIYPQKADADAVSKQIDNMEKDYIQQKFNVRQSGQNINNNIGVGNEHTEGAPNEILIEIPSDMYIKDMPVSQYIDLNDKYPPVSDGFEINTPDLPVFSQLPVLPEQPELSGGASDEPIPEKTEDEEPERIFPPETVPDSKIIPFDREKAIEYAHRWALDRNSDYYNFDDIGGDCTNYISQILLAGGCKMDRNSLTYGWYYNTANDKSPSWTGVEQLYNYLIRKKDYGIIAAEIDVRDVEAGDIAQLSFNGKSFQHTPFIVSVKRDPDGEVSLNQVKICAHSFDSQNRPLDTYQWKKIRFIRILGHIDSTL